MITYRALIKQAEENATGAATAEYLLQGLANKKRHELYTDRSAVSDDLVAKFNSAINELKTNMPIQYILHKAYFLTYELFVDERVMIPRFETEDLVLNTILKIKTWGLAPTSILDVGTGSGAIAIALAEMFPGAKIFATDISNSALEVAHINIKKHNLEKKINLYQADLFGRLNTEFDLIVSNPPYIPEDEINTLAVSIRDYEPKTALDGGKRGFEIIERIVRRAPNYITADGLLALEIDPRQAELIKALAPNTKFEKDNQDFIRYAFIKY